FSALSIMANRRRKAKHSKITALYRMAKYGRDACSKHDGKVSALFKKVKGKRVSCSKLDGKSELQCMKEDSSIDRISELPDELLGLILSHLTFKEATVTSILSRRWRYLWTFTRRLDFDGMKSLRKLLFGKGKLHEERSNYVGWVNRVIALRKDSSIEDFKVFFNLGKPHEGFIDEWLKYALERKVQTLELDLNKRGWGSPRDEEFYSFPYRFLNMGKENCSNYSEPHSIHFKQLKKISLSHVKVNGEALEFFLRNCPLLEDLSVSFSRDLFTLRVIGPFPSLKRLEISWCHNLKLVEIRDLNLVHLKYRGKNVHFFLHNLPMLVDLYVGLSYVDRMEDVLGQLFRGIHGQLQTLNVEINHPQYIWDTEGFYSTVKMSNLKQLVVTYLVSFDVDCLLALTNVIRAAPCLEKFVLKTQLSGKFHDRWIQRIKNVYSSELREVEFVGYCGLLCELELIMDLVENAAAPEKIIIDPRKFYFFPTQSLSRNSCSIRSEKEARAHAKKQLAQKLPPRINLVIL
ncbi:hypothetical protein C2S51_035566, partial [Perilla frutescens var. frutescens]